MRATTQSPTATASQRPTLINYRERQSAVTLIDVGAQRLARNGLRFAFYGRVSTEDNQDPEASRNWQRSRALSHSR